MPTEVQGLGMGLPDLKSKKKGKQKVSKESHVTEALDKLREQTRETVKELESVTGAQPGGGDELGKDAMVEDWVKQFEEIAGTQVCTCFAFGIGTMGFVSSLFGCKISRLIQFSLFCLNLNFSYVFGIGFYRFSIRILGWGFGFR